MGPTYVCPPNSTATLSTSGSVTYTFTWDGGFFQTPPPSSVWVHETSNASWGARGDLYGYKSGSEDDGLGGSPVDTSSPDGTQKGQVSAGSKWEQEDASSGTFSVTISGSAEVDLSQPPLADGEDWNFAYQLGFYGYGANATLADRTIITNDQIETSYYKTYDPNTSEATVADHNRNSDGSISTDSVVT